MTSRGMTATRVVPLDESSEGIAHNCPSDRDAHTLRDHPNDPYESLQAPTEENPVGLCSRMCQKLWIAEPSCLWVLCDQLGLTK
jgi:hypothetical protein